MRKKSPVEIASDLGAKAFDLHCYGDTQARAALRVVARVNPEMLAWLRDRLLDITAQRPLPDDEAQSASSVAAEEPSRKASATADALSERSPRPAFPVYQAVEWQCRYVDPETQLCCARLLNHDGEHSMPTISKKKA